MTTVCKARQKFFSLNTIEDTFHEEKKMKILAILYNVSILVQFCFISRQSALIS